MLYKLNILKLLKHKINKDINNIKIIKNLIFFSKKLIIFVFMFYFSCQEIHLSKATNLTIF